MVLRALVLVLVGVGLLGTAAPQVHAQDGELTAGSQEGVSPSGPAVEAQAHYQAGIEHYEAREFREAARQFELASRRMSSPDLWFNISRCYEELDQPNRAAEFLERYLRDRADAPDREAIQARIDRLRTQAAAQVEARATPDRGRLRVVGEGTGEQVVVDEDVVGTAPMSETLELSTGQHRVRSQHPDRIPFHALADVSPAATSTAYIASQDETRYELHEPARVFTYVLGGLALVALAGSVTFGILALSADDPDQSDYASVSDYALGAAIVLGLSTLIVYFIEGNAGENQRIAGEGTL